MPRTVAPVVAPGSLAGSPQPTLSAGELVLRPWRSADAPAVAAAYAEPDIRRWHTRTMTPAEAEAWIASWPGRWRAEDGAGWAVATGPVLLGQISLRSLDLAEGAGELSYWVLPAARGRRVADRAVAALSAWAFGGPGLHRIELQHATANLASCRVAARAGYAFEGIRRAAAAHADGWHDMHLHARLAGDR